MTKDDGDGDDGDDGFPVISFPTFSSAPPPSTEVAERPDKRGRAVADDRHQDHRQDDSGSQFERLFVIQCSGDLEYFKYGRLQSVPDYKTQSSLVFGLTEPSLLPEPDAKAHQEMAVSGSTLPLYPKQVKATLARMVQENPDGFIRLFDFDDSLIHSVYDAALVRSDQSRALSERIDADPFDVQAWIQLAATDASIHPTKPELERRAAILEKAIAQVPTSTQLITEYMTVHEQLHGGQAALALYRQLAEQNSLLRPHYFAFRLHNSCTFNVFSIMEEFDPLDTPSFPAFLYHAGYTERALRIYEFLVKRHCRGLAPSRWLFDSGMFSYDCEPVTDFLMPSLVSSDAEAMAEWLRVEAYRSFKFATASSSHVAYPDEPEEDPDRVVLYDDIVPFSFKPSLDDLFGLFGFSSSIPEPFVLVGFRSLDFLRTVGIVSTLPSDVRSVLKGICLDMLPMAQDPSSVAFHYFVLEEGVGQVAVETPETALALALYFAHQSRVREALLLKDRCPISPLFVELLMRTGGDALEYIESRSDHGDRSSPLLPYHLYLTEGITQMVKRLHGTVHDGQLSWFSLIMHSDDKLLLPQAREWLDVHHCTRRAAFDALVQFELCYSAGFRLRRVLKSPLDDYGLFVLSCFDLNDLLVHYSQEMLTPFAAIQQISHSSSQVVLHVLNAIARHPGSKQVYLAGIDRLLAVGDTVTAMNVLTAMEERGLRCRTLIEELQLEK